MNLKIFDFTLIYIYVWGKCGEECGEENSGSIIGSRYAKQEKI